MLKIGDFSKLSRISIRMLRHYDEIRLLVPANTDHFTGYRYYHEAQLLDANRIKALKDMGFGLAAIHEIIERYEDADALQTFLSVQQAVVSEQVEQGKHRLLLLESAIQRLGKDGSMMKYDVTIKTLPERYVASVRKVIPAYDQESILWNILMEETAEMNLVPADPCYSLAIFHDESYKENDVDVEIQGTVQGIYTDTENVAFKTVAPVDIASATYKGSYEQITAVNATVADWVNTHGYEFDGPMFCIYHVSPAQTQNPDDWITEVCYPVKKK